MEKKICQSCGMPMVVTEQFGTNKDGSQNQDYCTYCYIDGSFTSPMTMDEMITHCAQFWEEFDAESENQMTREDGIVEMRRVFPTFKRWKTN